MGSDNATQLYQAELTGLMHDGKILHAAILNLDQAIALRRSGLDVVVCGPNGDDK